MSSTMNGANRTPAVRLRIRAALEDARSLLRFGPGSPQWCERLWVDPQQIRTYTDAFPRTVTGVRDGEWDLQTQPLDRLPKYVAALRHWGEGLSWEEAGAVDEMLALIRRHGSVDGCTTVSDVLRRFELLDETFERVAREGRLATRAELGEPIGERGGILVHVDRTGTVVFGAGGVHRLAMATVLGFRQVPAQLGVLHKKAERHWRTRVIAVHGNRGETR